MMMYNQIREDTLYIMLYAAVTVIAMLASCYLLFRRANAIAPDVTPPVRLRRWTAAFFAVFVVNHVWYMGPTFFLTSSEDIKITNLVGGLLDCMTFFPLAIVVLLSPCPSVDWLFAVDEYRLNNIYGPRVETIRPLASRQLC